MNKKELLTRKNYGRRELPLYKERLCNALEYKISDDDFIDLEQTDSIKDCFFSSLKSLPQRAKTTYPAAGDQIEKIIAIIGDALTNEAGYLITKQSDICGALRIKLNVAIKHYKNIIDIDGDSLCLLSIDKSKGVYLDYYEEYDCDDRFSYDLTIWGINLDITT